MNLRVLFSLCLMAVSSASLFAASHPIKAVFDESGGKTYWSNGKLPANFHIAVSIEIGNGMLSYDGVNTSTAAGEAKPADPKGHVTAFSGPIDGQIHPSKGPYWDHLAIREIDTDEYLVEKYRDGALVVGEFLKFSADGRTMIRHGVVARAAADGTSKAYVEYFTRR